MKTYQPKTTVSARHLMFTDSLKQYALSKLDSIISDFPRIIHAHIILDQRKYEFSCEVVLQGVNHSSFRGIDTTNNMYASIDLCMDKLERQMRKYKTKVLAHRHHFTRHQFRRQTHRAAPVSYVTA